jgi:hypothetical protein
MDFTQSILSLREFFLDRQYLNLFASTLVLFLACFLAWYVYSKQLAMRNLFEIPKVHETSRAKTLFNKIMYFLKHLLIFPLYAFMWFLIFSFLLFLLSKERPIDQIFYFGIIVVAATRIGAYVSEKLAEDMAKLLPWSLILIFLIDPTAITFSSIASSVKTFYLEIPKVAKYLLFIMAIEWLLRIATWIAGPKDLAKAK